MGEILMNPWLWWLIGTVLLATAAWLALRHMTAILRQQRAAIQAETWLKDGLARLALELAGDLALPDLGAKAVDCICRHLDAGRGALYLHHPEDQQLIRLGGFALTGHPAAPATLAMGEGLVGQVAAERKAIAQRNYPADTAPVTSATLRGAPRATYTWPLVYEHDLYGVMEVASLAELSRFQREFCDATGLMVAARLYTALRSQTIRDLLESTRQAQSRAEDRARQLQDSNVRLEEQQQQLAQQTEELRQVNAQLEEQHQQIRQQNEELQQANAQLEEHHQQLVQQTEEARQQAESLKAARDELLQRTGELEAANRHKSEFLATMSHELRTPLNSIILLSQMMSRNPAGNLTADDCKKTTIINAAGEELLRLINDILDLSKIEAGRMAVHVAEVSTTDLLTELRDLFGSVAQAKNLAFTLTDEVNGRLHTDRDKLGQVLRNLVTNAIKFTRAGEVSVRVSVAPPADAAGARIRFVIADTGIGIPADQQDKIFDAFHQVDGSLSRRFGGTGLGLAIARKLAVALGGGITLTSAEGQGSCFELVVPRDLATPAGAVAAPPGPAFVAPTVAGLAPGGTVADDRAAIRPGDRVVLVVEDDLVFAETIGDLARQEGVQFLHAATAGAGLTLARRHLPTAILLDLLLPDYPGLELLRQLKSEPALRKIPVQILSCCEVDPAVLELGIQEFRQKPLDEDQLRAALREIQPPPRSGPKKLLIVEDDPTHREALAAYIQDKRWTICAVATEAEALAELADARCDLLIIDLGLKQGSGWNVCRRVQEQDLRIPIIIYTGQDLSEDDQKQVRRYAGRVVLKTVRSGDRLRDEVQGLLMAPPAPVRNPPSSRLADRGPGRLAGRRILVADDDIKNVFVISTALEEQGAAVLDAQSGKSALAILQREPVDLVLIDIMMPDLDGYETIRRIRAAAPVPGTPAGQGARVPVIALTAKALKGDREKCLAAGADDYLAKPVDYDALISLVEGWCTKGGAPACPA